MSLRSRSEGRKISGVSNDLFRTTVAEEDILGGIVGDKLISLTYRLEGPEISILDIWTFMMTGMNPGSNSKYFLYANQNTKLGKLTAFFYPEMGGVPGLLIETSDLGRHKRYDGGVFGHLSGEEIAFKNALGITPYMFDCLRIPSVSFFGLGKIKRVRMHSYDGQSGRDRLVQISGNSREVLRELERDFMGKLRITS